ncbi:non-heme iron oxygenase ferredoxin subunit [Neoactinobaculum massilliense]|uniref:non-heme iron oxygenase ferredoxin subunit n=1 Tax=Neoactinobaculum massilliense TaxID=2364794 RepID=UPI000F5248D6|nr:non-heme iron oxygenase ferredoxin subunit [Neoactinobaculum massilliense]
MSLQRACATTEVEPAAATQVTLTDGAGKQILVCVARDSDGTWHAIGDTCSHARVSLSEGDVFDHEIECWKHGSSFDLFTGKPNSLPAVKPVPVFALEISGADVLVDVDHTI